MTGSDNRKTISVSRVPTFKIPKDFFIHLYAVQGRSFPWRSDSATPFGILIAEILLKQTRADKVAKVWPNLMRRYHNVDKLAHANPSELFESIAVLGFGNQRTRALIDLSATVMQIGKIPSQPDNLMQLPYVGMYTAYAVACFAFGRCVPIVDLSVVRVISRFVGIKPPRDIRRAGIIWDIAWALLPKREFQEHNYGLLDFAATVCKPRSPCCHECSVSINCAYARRARDRQQEPGTLDCNACLPAME